MQFASLNSLKAQAYLVHDVEHAVIKVLLREDGGAVVVLVLPSVVLDKQLLEGHGAVLLIGHHQLVAEAKQNELGSRGKKAFKSRGLKEQF